MATSTLSHERRNVATNTYFVTLIRHRSIVALSYMMTTMPSYALSSMYGNDVV
ncbi:hypothetical protein FOMPIDRAFT_1023423 [Fomitopsis schrenkii]|uniref:Uncharacterized protein n=1 Tax=Fomitopsis schrenkii TaxID=2126942 RepID=S8FI69_FOMSC|nr:hypothetical protein FOMPIDRAFT_1023423 [Fomitopsis schrenkii]